MASSNRLRMVDCQFGGESTAQDAIDIAGSLLGAVLSAACLLTACGGSDDPPQDQPVTITVAGPNAVSTCKRPVNPS